MNYNKINTSIALTLIVFSLISTSCDKSEKQNSGLSGAVDFQIDLPQGPAKKGLQTIIQDGDSVLDAMQSLQASEQIQYQAQEMDGGVLIEQIEGVSNENPGRAWQYTINGKLANQGVVQQSLSPGDQIRWCFLQYADREQCTR